MVFIEYEKLKKQFVYMQGICDQILREKEKYFTKILPNAIRYDKVSVEGGKRDNGFDDYLEDCQRAKIDERLNEAIVILQARAELLRIKEDELRASKDILDIIYAMHYLDGAKVTTIAKALSYSESQVYRLLQKIEKRILNDRRDDKAEADAKAKRN